MASHVDLSVEIPAEHARNIFGELDEHVKSIERTLNVDIIPRGDSVHIQGTPLQALPSSSSSLNGEIRSQRRM